MLAIDQVSEVSQALSWTMDNIGHYSGDPNRVFLMGHSSGISAKTSLLTDLQGMNVEGLVVDIRLSLLVGAKFKGSILLTDSGDLTSETVSGIMKVICSTKPPSHSRVQNIGLHSN